MNFKEKAAVSRADGVSCCKMVYRSVGTFYYNEGVLNMGLSVSPSILEYQKSKTELASSLDLLSCQDDEIISNDYVYCDNKHKFQQPLLRLSILSSYSDSSDVWDDSSINSLACEPHSN